MNRVGLLGLTALLCFFTKAAAAQSVPFGDSRVQAPELAAPQRGSVAGQYAGVAFGPADVARGEFNLPSPFSAPEERGAILVSPFPTYAPDQGLSEWGLGWGVTLGIVRSRITGDLDYRTDERTGPWGRMLRGSDGFWYPVGLRVAVRVKEAPDDTLIAYLPDGSQWTFGMRVVNARGTYAWYPTTARDAVGHTASLTYDALPQGRPFLRRIEYGGFGPAHTAAVELTYESLTRPATDLRSGFPLVLDRRVRRVSVQAKSVTTGAFTERWHDDIVYSSDGLGVAYYLAAVSRVFASGESAPQATYTYRLPSAEWGASAPRAVPELDALLVGDPGDIIQPSRTAVLDVDDDGRPDLERASDLRTFVHGDGGFTSQDLPPETGHESSDCRPAPLYENDPRLMARMRAPAGPMDVVVLRTSAFRESTSLTVCDRAGNVRTQATLTGDWDPTTATKLVDVTRDHLPDLVRIAAGEYAVLPNVGNDAFGPVHVGALSPAFEPSGSWVQDMNGDGVADLVARSSDSVAVWLGHGQLTFDSDAQIFLFYDSGLNVASLDGYTFAFVDANKDGLSDLLLTKDNQSALFINSGTTFEKADVSGLQQIPAFAGNPVPVDLAGTGDTELTYVFDGKGYSLALDHAETALLVGANDGKGNILSFRYGRAQPVAGARMRHSVLSQLTVASTGEDTVTYEYAYASPKLHSEGLFLLGFEDVTRRGALATSHLSFLDDDRYAGVLLSSIETDDLVPGTQRVSFRAYDDALDFDIPWKRLRAEGSGWQSTDPLKPGVVLERTEYGAYALSVCPAASTHTTSAGVLHSDRTFVRPGAFAESLACLEGHAVIAGSHPDATLDFRHEADIARNDAGQVTSLAMRDAAQSVVVAQTVAYTPEGRILSITQPASGTATYAHDALGLLQSVMAADGTITRVADRDAVTDALRALETDRGMATTYRQSFRFDGQERLQRAWTNVGSASDARPNETISYRYAAGTTPALTRTRVLLDAAAGTYVEHADLSAATGTSLATAHLLPDGWAFDGVTRLSRATRQTTTLMRAATKQDIALLDVASLSTGATQVTSAQTSAFGFDVSASKKFHADVERTERTVLQIVDGALTRADTENAEFTTRVTGDEAQRVIDYREPSGIHSGYAYDALGRLRRITLPDGTHHALDFDDFARPRRVVREGVAAVDYVYDASGHLAERRYTSPTAAPLSAPARRVQYAYDNAGRVTLETDQDGASGASATFRYYWDGSAPSAPAQRNALGLLSAVVGDGLVKTFGYRIDGREVSRTVSLGTWRTIATSSTYDEDGQEHQHNVVVTDAAQRELFRESQTLQRDAYGRLAGELRDGKPFVTYGYDVNGLPLWANYSSPYGHGEVVTLQHDALTRARVGMNQNNTSWAAAVSVRKNRRGLTDSQEITVGATVLHRAFQYTAEGFLASSVDAEATYAYGYDGAALPAHIASTARGVTDARGFARTGSVLTAGSHHHTFDALGRAIERDDVTLAYGPNGQVASAHRGAGSWGYVYDETGERIAKTIGGAYVAAYLGGTYLDASTVTVPISFAGTIVGVERATLGASDKAFHLVPADLLGTALAGTDGVANLPSPFGDRAAHPDTAAALDFATKGYDADLGVVRMGVRDFDPAMSRFLTPDPTFLEDPTRCVGRTADCSLYAYSRNAPNDFVDPSGREPLEIGAGLVAGGVVLFTAVYATAQYATNPKYREAAGSLGHAIGTAVDERIQSLAQKWEDWKARDKPVPTSYAAPRLCSDETAKQDGHHLIPRALMNVMVQNGMMDAATRKELEPAQREGTLKVDKATHIAIHRGLSAFLQATHPTMETLTKGFQNAEDWQTYVATVLADSGANIAAAKAQIVSELGAYYGGLVVTSVDSCGHETAQLVGTVYAHDAEKVMASPLTVSSSP